MSINSSDHRPMRARQGARLIPGALALCALLLAASGGTAAAADWPENAPLRGSFPAGPLRWDGVVFGAHAGWSSMSTDFGSADSSLVSYILRNTTVESEFSPSGWTTLPSDISSSASYGGFLGYNFQWDRLVVGVDIGYSRPSSLQTQASDGLTRIVTTSDNVEHIVTVSAQSSLKLVDYGTFRARAGYAVGQFLPYAMIGAAVGRFNYANSATVTDFWTPAGGATVQFGPMTNSNGQSNAFAAGFLGGLGMDVAVLPNVFLRGEWEFIAFAPVSGINSTVNTVRAGIGLRF